jgi:hypothetical protein
LFWILLLGYPLELVALEEGLGFGLDGVPCNKITKIRFDPGPDEFHLGGWPRRFHRSSVGGQGQSYGDPRATVGSLPVMF